MFDEFNDFDLNRFDLNAFDLSNLIIEEIKNKLASNDLNNSIIQLFKLNKLDYSNIDLNDFNLDKFLIENLKLISSKHFKDVNIEIYKVIDNIKDNKESLVNEIVESDYSFYDDNFLIDSGLYDDNFLENDINFETENKDYSLFQTLENDELMIIQRHLLPILYQKTILFLARLCKTGSNNTLHGNIHHLIKVLPFFKKDTKHRFINMLENLKNTELGFKKTSKDILDNDEDFDYFNIISSYKTYDNGDFQIVVHDSIYNMLKKLTFETGLISSNDIFRLNSKYSVLLYELLSIYPEVTEYDFSLIRDFINYYHWEEGETIYQIINFIIKPSISDINENTRFNIDYKIIKDKYNPDVIKSLEFINNKKTEF